MVKQFGLLIVAVLLFALIAPVAFIYGLFVHNLKRYFFIIAIGIDQLGGSILYMQPDWTISSWTWIRASQGSKYHKYFMNIIDFFFGENHCAKAYIKEMQIHQNMVRR